MSIYAPYQGTYLNEEFIGYERAKKFIKEWDVWEKCFPTHVLLWLVNEKIKMKDICGIKYIPVSTNSVSYYEAHSQKNVMVGKETITKMLTSILFLLVIKMPILLRFSERQFSWLILI